MRPAIDARALLHRITRSPAGFVFGAKAVNAVIGLGLTVVIARALGPMGRAEYFLPSTLAIGVFTAFHLSIDLATFWAIWERSASARAIVRPVARVAALAAIATTVAYLLIGYGFGV